MGDNLFGKSKSKQRNLKNQKGILYCAVCNGPLPSGSIFCSDCDPPLPPGKEPEETGLSFGQALLRIGVLVILFALIAFSKLDISFDRLLAEKQMKGELETLSVDEQPKDGDFLTVHIVIAPLVNIRSEPSMDGKIILVAEQGMDIELIEGSEDWSKVRVLGKTGWIFNELFKSEILAPE